jgi:hypothetical protein
MNIVEIDMAEFGLVEILNGTPHCKSHGAMNKITRHDDGGGIWRCITVHSITKIRNGNQVSKKENDCVCRAGCMEVRK